MERLTSRYPSGLIAVPNGMVPEALERLAAYEDTGYTTEDFDALCREMSDLRTALALPTYESLRNAIRRGRVILLPVKPALRPGHSDSCVYFIEDGEIIEDYVCYALIGESSNGQMAVSLGTFDGASLFLQDFGKTFFCTEAEAKAALLG